MKSCSRRTTAVILSVIMILSCFAGLSFSSGAITSGDYTYYVLDDGTLSVTKYEGSDTEVSVPSEIDGKTVTDISYTFMNCTFLTSVTIPDSVTKIGSQTFMRCSSLKNVSIPNSVTEIRDRAFNQCASLEKISVPDSVKTIEYLAFGNCVSLTDINIPNDIEVIDENIFEGCTALESIEIPDSVTEISGQAFYRCKSLKNVEIPDSVTKLGYQAFGECASLKSITIPANVSELGMYIFEGCTSLNEINVDDGNEKYKSIDGVLFNKTETEIISYPGGRSGEYTIPDSVTVIYPCSFLSCSGLTGVSIPESVREIYSAAFFDCSSLSHVSLPNGLKGISEMAFMGCTSLESISIPDTVEGIGEDAFLNCCNLKNIKIPDSVTYIGERALGFYIAENKEFLTIDGFVICASAGSAAQTYADDNSIKFVDVNECGHEDTVIKNAKDASCSENGYSGDIFCVICETEIKAGEKTDALGHIDENGDGICDRCSEQISENKSCGCICHKNGFMKFIYKIFRFFWRIFGIRKSCNCGQLHY